MLTGIKALLHKLKNLHYFSKHIIQIGFCVMLYGYIAAVAAYWYAPYAASYYSALAIHRGLLEAAPACLTVGVFVGFLSDFLLQSQNHDDTSSRD